MGLFNPGSGTGGVRARAQRLEMVIGILGFFTLMAAIQAVAFLAKGNAHAVDAVVLLLLLCYALLWVVRKRRSLEL